MASPLKPSRYYGKRVLVCGGRRHAHGQFVATVLDLLRPSEVIHGACPTGADRQAHEWATLHGIPERAYPAEWTTYGPAAGPRRNQRMLDESRPDYVLAFAGEKGTADMVRRARKAGVEVIDKPVLG